MDPWTTEHNRSISWETVTWVRIKGHQICDYQGWSLIKIVSIQTVFFDNPHVGCSWFCYCKEIPKPNTSSFLRILNTPKGNPWCSVGSTQKLGAKYGGCSILYYIIICTVPISRWLNNPLASTTTLTPLLLVKHHAPHSFLWRRMGQWWSAAPLQRITMAYYNAWSSTGDAKKKRYSEK